MQFECILNVALYDAYMTARLALGQTFAVDIFWSS